MSTKRLVFTFDDGVRSHYDLVRPLLNEHKMTGTFFIPGNRDLWLHTKDPAMREGGLSWTELADMHNDGFELGNHTLDHLPLTELNRAEIVKQVEGLDAQFEANGLPRAVSLCLPGYWHSDNVSRSLKGTTIRFARTGYIDGDLLPNHPDKRPDVRHYCPGSTDPHCVYCTGILNDWYQTETFIADLEATGEGSVAIFAAHGFRLDSWWKMFQEMVEYVASRGYQTVNMRDLPVEAEQAK